MAKDVARRSTGGVSTVDLDALPELQLDDLRGETEASLLARGAAYTKEYERIEHHPTILLKNIAAIVIAIRIQLDDMRGSGHEYRQKIAGMYRQSGIGPDSTSKVQTAVRWHVNNLLRRHMTARELEAINLKPTSALERMQDSRAKNAALIAGLKAAETAEASTPKKSGKGKKTSDEEPANAGHPVKATADHLRLAHAASSILDQLDEDVIKSHMAPGQRAKLDEELAAMQQRISKLRRLSRAKS
jgi:hypothetical protein